MIKVFERVPLDSAMTTRDVILAGRVAKITDLADSKKGNKYLRIVLTGEVFDPELEMDISEEKEVIFLDKTEGKYGPQLHATDAAKLKIKPGKTVAIRASEVTTVGDDGTEKVTYYGSMVTYCNGRRFNFKFSKKGNEASVIVGTAVINTREDGSRTLSVPLSMWDKDIEENYTAWVNVTSPVSEEILSEISPVKGDDGKEHKPLVAVSFTKLTEVVDPDSKRVEAYSGEAITIKKVG